MSVTQRDMKCSPAQVWAVLADGWLLGLWVVGASRIRAVDSFWPDVDAKVHHSVGIWPMLLDDTTSVLATVPGRSVTLLARGWPAGEAKVRMDIEHRAAGCRVVMTEDVVRGPGLLVPRPVRSLALHPRNTESLRRLALLAENRPSAGQAS